MSKILIPPQDYQGKEPDYLPDGTWIDHHVDGESWAKFAKGFTDRKEKGWFTGPYDQYYYNPQESLYAPSS